MREVDLIVVGKLNESYLQDAESYFRQKISKRINFRIITVLDEKTKDGAGDKDIERVKEKEGVKIEHLIDQKAMVIAMDLTGKQFSRSTFQDLVMETLNNGMKIQIIIGGSLGISKNVLHRSKMKIAFSKMTYPHQLFRIMVLEELNRALT